MIYFKIFVKLLSHISIDKERTTSQSYSSIARFQIAILPPINHIDVGKFSAPRGCNFANALKIN